MALPDHDVIQLLIDKVRFYKFAGENDLAIPKTYFLENRTDALEASRQISYPCALKPPYRGRDWNVHINEKALPAANASEFLALYDRCAPYSDALIAQRWISGPDQNLYSCNCYFSRDSVPLATFVAKKLRQWPPETGYSCLGEEVRADPVLEETVRLFSSVGYQGLGYLEMKLDDEDGKFYIIEPNVGRPTGRSAIAEAGGVEILHTMYCDIYGLPLPEQREQKYEGVKWIHLLRDLQSAWHYYRRGQLTFRQWRQSIKGRKAYAVFDWRDPAPFLREISQGFRQVLSVRWVRAPAVRSKAEKAT
jgi:predicted ATP-grasp superfamily ATP-dependent carboligase